MDNAKFFKFLYIFLIISVILFMIWIVFWLKGNGKDCISDPLKYVEDRVEGKCICYDKDFKQIIFGSSKDEIENTKFGEMYPNISIRE